MARTPKPLRAIDEAALQALLGAVERSGLTRRELTTRTNMSMNRIGIILRGEQPPATIGELDVLARAAGTTAGRILAEAEEAVAQMVFITEDEYKAAARAVPGTDYVLAALDRDDDVEVEAQQEEP